MKTVFSSHSELCHAFAAGMQDHGRSTNMSFSDGALYSYGTVIMRKLEHDGKPYLLVNTTSYSNSTAKHIIHAQRAVSHIQPQFTIGDLERGERLWSINPQDIINYHEGLANHHILKSKRSRVYKDSHIRWATHSLAEAARVAEFFGIKRTQESLAEIEQRFAEANAEAERERKAHAEERERQQIEIAIREVQRLINSKSQDIHPAWMNAFGHTLELVPAEMAEAARAKFSQAMSAIQADWIAGNRYGTAL